MTMPKGYKSKFGYATVSTDGGMGFHEIAEKMTASGDKMNHATARNVLLRALKKISVPICKMHGVTGEYLENEATKTACDPRFQEAIAQFIADEISK
jgi:hypothetical protein